MGLVEKHLKDIFWLKNAMRLIRRDATFAEAGIPFDAGTSIRRDFIEDHIRCKNTGHLKIRTIPSENIIWVAHGTDMSDLGDFNTKEEALAVQPNEDYVFDIDLDAKYEVVDESGRNILDMSLSDEDNAWICLYCLIGSKAFLRYVNQRIIEKEYGISDREAELILLKSEKELAEVKQNNV